jgi:hypothetical protein
MKSVGLTASWVFGIVCRLQKLHKSAFVSFFFFGVHESDHGIDLAESFRGIGLIHTLDRTSAGPLIWFILVSMSTLLGPNSAATAASTALG